MANIETQAPEFVEKVVAINRVSKTVKGGRIMKFSALVVVSFGLLKHPFQLKHFPASDVRRRLDGSPTQYHLTHDYRPGSLSKSAKLVKRFFPRIAQNIHAARRTLRQKDGHEKGFFIEDGA